MRITDLAFVGTILFAARIPCTEAGKNNNKSNDKGKNRNNNKGLRAPATKPNKNPDGNVNDLFKSLNNNPQNKAGNRNASNNSKPTNKKTNNSQPNNKPSNMPDDDFSLDDDNDSTPISTDMPTLMPTTYMPTTYMPTTYIPTYIPTYMPTYYWYDDIVNGNTWGNAGSTTSTWWGPSSAKAGKSTSTATWWGSSGGKAGKSVDTVGAWWGGVGIGGKGRKMKEVSVPRTEKVSKDNNKNATGKRKRYLQAGKSQKYGLRANFDNGGKADKDFEDAVGSDDVVFYAYELQTDVPTPVPTTPDMAGTQTSASTRNFPSTDAAGKSEKDDLQALVRGEHRTRNRARSTPIPTFIPTYYPTYFSNESESFVSGDTPKPTYIPTYYPTEYLPKAEKTPPGRTIPREWLRDDESESDSGISGGKSMKRKLKIIKGRGRKRTRQ